MHILVLHVFGSTIWLSFGCTSFPGNQTKKNDVRSRSYFPSFSEAKQRRLYVVCSLLYETQPNTQNPHWVSA